MSHYVKWPMETLGNTEVTKSKSKKYACEACDYITSQKANYTKHLSTGKHNKITMTTGCSHKCVCGKLYSNRQNLYRHRKTCDVVNNPTAKVTEVTNCFQMFPEDHNRHECACGSTYSTRSGLWKHKRACLHGVGEAENVVLPTVDNTEVLEVLDLLQSKMDRAEEERRRAEEKMDRAEEKMDRAEEKLDRAHESNELLKEEMKQIKSGVLTAVAEPKVVNNYNNINLFLNERCGNAIPIQDFVKDLVIGVEDVDYALQNGKASGIANIIERRVEELGVYSRPLHCTDVKRATMYVKGAEGWDKEKGEMTKLIQDVNHAQVKGIKIWEAAHPRCFDTGHDREKDQWFKIVKCLTNNIEGVGTRKISKRCYEVSKINQEDMV